MKPMTRNDVFVAVVPAQTTSAKHETHTDSASTTATDTAVWLQTFMKRVRWVQLVQPFGVASTRRALVAPDSPIPPTHLSRT